MKLKNGLLLSLLSALSFCAIAQGDNALRTAYCDGAMAHVQGLVVDERGLPVSNATVRVEFSSLGDVARSNVASVRTDEVGRFEASGRANWKVDCSVRRTGYYDSSFSVSFYDAKACRVQEGEWVHDGLTRKVVLRRIQTRKALSVFPESRRMGTWKIPVLNEWIGFDLETFDWVSPYGTGVHDDMLLRFSARTISHVRGSYQMEVCFTNNPCAGMHLGEGDALSDLKIPHVADPSGAYAGYHRFERDFTGENKTDTYLKKGMYAVVRTRTKVDADGKLVSACYGVISGIWISGRETMRMEDASFNSACNDLAIEDGYYLRKRLEEYNCRNRE